MQILVLDKDHTLEKHFKKLLEEQAELNHELMKSLSTGVENRANIIEETLDNIQMCIGILDYFDVTEEDLCKHNQKLLYRGWGIKRKLEVV